jgi:sporulation protein YlmC with PRC-barrel domain
MKTMLATASLVALMAVPAFAQTTTAPESTTTPPAAQQEMAPAPAQTTADSGQMSASDLLNKSVRNANNDSIGDINDIRIDSDGKIAAVIVGAGGFLGMGEKNVALPFEELSFQHDSDGNLVVMSKVTKESLQAAPEWKKPEDRM